MNFLIKWVRILLKITIFDSLYFLSKFFPRKNKIFLFGGSYKDNSKYLFNTLRTNNKFKCVWLINDKKEYKKYVDLNLNGFFYLFSIKGIWYLLRSKVYFYSYGFNVDLPYFFSNGADNFYLWHGVGIKNILFKDKNSIKNWESRNILERRSSIAFNLKPSYMLATSDFMASHFKDCFRLNDESIVYAGYPRNINLNKYSDDLENEIILKDDSAVDKVLFYFPTWRDNEPDFMLNVIDWGVLNQCLINKNYKLFVKPHPSSNIPNFGSYSNISLIEKGFDIYTILPKCDVLITDYSSIYFDYILKDKGATLLFPFDYEQYVSRSRELAMSYDDAMPSVKAYSFEEFISRIEKDSYTSNEDIIIKDVKQLFWGRADRSLVEVLEDMYL